MTWDLMITCCASVSLSLIGLQKVQMTGWIIRSFQDFELTLPWVGNLEIWRSLVRATWEAQRPGHSRYHRA